MMQRFWKRAQNVYVQTRALDWQMVLLIILFVMFPLGYLESFRWPFGGVKATHGILKALFLLLGGIMVVFRLKNIRPMKPLELLLGLWVLSYAISTVFSLNVEASVLSTWYPLISAGVIIALAKVKLQRKHILLFVVLSISLVFLTFVFSFFSIIYRYEVDSIYYSLFLDHRANYFLDELRKTGRYVSLGPYIMLIPLSTLFLTEKRAAPVRKLFSILVFLMGVLIAVLSNNRIDALIVAIHFFILLWLMPRRFSIVVLLLALPVVWFSLYTTEKYFGYNLEERILRPSKERDLETIDMRFTYLETALYNFKNYPLFGTGPNTYNDVSEFPLRRYFVPGKSQYYYKSDTGIGIHNIFVERLADTGLAGFLSFVALLFYFFRQDVLTIIKKKQSEGKTRYILFSLSSWTWILYGITDNGYGAQGMVTFFFLRGILNHI